MSNAATIINRRYLLGDSLGKGGMGEVYRAHDRLTGQNVALKRVYQAFDLPEDSLTTEELRLALAREFASLASLRHPNIIGVLDYGFDSKRQPYFTMEYLEDAQTIRDAARGQPSYIQIDLITQILRALAYIHRRGVLHRDLKPGNVLVIMRNNAPAVKVLDFGLASEFNHSYGVSGTMAYLAPEIITGEQPAGIAADLYSVGIIMYEILTGHYPFEGKTINTLIQHVLKAAIDVEIDAVPPEMRPILARMLAKDPSARYPNAETVIGALSEIVGTPIPVDTERTRESFLQASRMVGREAELTTLIRALEDAKTGIGSTWLIGGESGVGKSRLLDELATRALVSGARVLRGYVSERGGIPYELWHDPLRYLLLGAEISGLESAVLKTVVPDIEALIASPKTSAKTPARLTGEAARQRFFSTMIDLYRRQDSLIVLILEDLHWALESLELLRQLIAAGLPLLIVGSYRDDEKPDLPASLPGAQLLRLQRLNADEIAALSESMLGETGGKEEIVRLLQRETEGNVFFLVETVRALAEEAGALSNIGRVTVPRAVLAGGIQSIIRRRLSRVPDWGQPLLKLAAVAGRQFELALLEHLARLQGIDELERWIAVTINAAVAEVQGNEWRFAHDKLRQTALDDLLEVERRRLHRQVARAIETQYPEPMLHAEELFYHWREAGERERELEYLLKAADRAINLTAIYPNALEWLHDALTRHGDQLEPALRGKMLNLLGRTYFLMSENAHAKTQYEAALLLGDAGIAADARLGLSEVDMRIGELTTALAYAEQALTHYRGVADQRGISEALHMLGWIQISKGEYETARGLLTDSLALRLTLNDQQGIGLCYNLLGNIALYLGEYETAQSNYERALALRTALGDVRGMSATLNNMALVAQDRADYDAAWAYQEQSLAIKRRINDRHGIEISLSNLGYLAQLKGDLSMTERCYLEALTLQREIGDKRGIGTTLTDLGTVAMNKDEDEIAELYFQECHRLKTEVEDRQGEAIYFANYAVFLMVRGRYAEARQMLDRGLELGREIGEPYLEGFALMEIGTIEELEGALADALTAYAQALAIFQGLSLPRETGIVLLGIARARSASGDHDAAAEALREAAAIILRLKVAADQCKPLIAAAHLAVDRGDPERAIRLLGYLETQLLIERTDRHALTLLNQRIDPQLRVQYSAAYERGVGLDVATEIKHLREGI